MPSIALYTALNPCESERYGCCKQLFCKEEI